MPRCDIIIPTYNSASVIALTLTAIEQQVWQTNWDVQIVVSDDGSTDATQRIVQEHSVKGRVGIQLVRGPHRGSAAARNRALLCSRADIVFFLGADIILRPQALQHHLQFHEHYPAPHAAALGMVKWDPRLRPTPLMEWMIHGGMQNEYDRILGQTIAPPEHFLYGAHVSLKRSLLAQQCFREDFTQYGWEDLELGRRLSALGTQLYVLHRAIGLHRHFYSVGAISYRQRRVGESAVVYQALYPHVVVLPKGSWAKYSRRWVAIHSGAIVVLRALVNQVNKKNNSFPILFSALIRLEFWAGALKMIKLSPKK